MQASSRLSISIWRTSRQRLAPSDARTAISRSRVVARASSMFATLAHAMRSSRPTAAANVYTVVRNPPTTLSIRLTTATVKRSG